MNVRTLPLVSDVLARTPEEYLVNKKRLPVGFPLDAVERGVSRSMALLTAIRDAECDGGFDMDHADMVQLLELVSCQLTMVGEIIDAAEEDIL